jgi:hypothetical protein
LKLRPEDATAAREILGYLNFSSGRPDPSFERLLNELVERIGWSRLRPALRKVLQQLADDAPAFHQPHQAEAVLSLTFDEVLPAYRAFHSDLLSHLSEKDFQQPLLLARVMEAIIEQGPPWTETRRVVSNSIDQLNDFLGYRPIAVLENGRRMQPYPHERFRPIPLYIRGVGVAFGPHREVISRTLELLRSTSADLLADAYFSLENLDELALDPRSHDHLHPVNKRTNYLFGEWDPQQIDLRGDYRRFVVRGVILDALQVWIREQKRVPAEEVLFDASAVLAGTILMASAISGAGPGTHDSTVSLSSLLPRVARQRDAFYARLLSTVTGDRAKRLLRHAKTTQQPFGHVRQHLNFYLAQYGTQQVQRRQVAYLFARMSYPQAARRQAAVMPCTSARFECEIHWRLAVARRSLANGSVRQASQLLDEAEDLLHRGINCGAIVDPWNVLGFQGQFPLFSTREDSVPDQRIEILLQLVDGILGVYAHTLEESAVRGQQAVLADVRSRFERFADFWDQFGTTTVQDLPPVRGHAQLESAIHVAQALSEWRAAGEAAGNIAFWREKVADFKSAQAYAQVVAALLDRKDHVAAVGLLMQWLSQADEVGLQAGPLSFDRLLLRSLDLLAELSEDSAFDPWPPLRRLFPFLEANAGELWEVPRLSEAGATSGGSWSGGPATPSNLDDEDGPESVFGAAYEGVVYRDSADDGQQGELSDDRAGLPDAGEFEHLEEMLEPRLQFLRMLAQLWQTSAAIWAHHAAQQTCGNDDRGQSDDHTDGDKDRDTAGDSPADNPVSNTEGTRGENAPASAPSVVAAEWQMWSERTRHVEEELKRLITDLAGREISAPQGDHDSNIEYDAQLQSKMYLIQATVNAAASFRLAGWMLSAANGVADDHAQHTSALDATLVTFLSHVMRGDVVAVRQSLPGFLKILRKQPMLYVPLDHGGDPWQILSARTMQALLRLLLKSLPRLGLLRETWHLLRTAHQMERASRPTGLAVTEFDRLFRIAIKCTLESLVRASGRWKSGRFSDDELVELVRQIVDLYLEQWHEHSSTMRLSGVEMLKVTSAWEQTRAFVQRYGSSLFHARQLTLGHVRAILHQGVEHFIDYLAEHEDPLHPLLMLEDLRKGILPRETAVEQLRTIYQIVVERYDRFLEYNSTTTQSDYGESFYTLLDFLRLETSYDRDAWNQLPYSLAHEVLSRLDRQDGAQLWEDLFSIKTEEMAARHLTHLQKLEKKYGMRLPSVTNHLQERFVKPLAVNRMVAHVRKAWNAAHATPQQDLSSTETSESITDPVSPAFDLLQSEIENYLKTTSGSGLEVPAWLRQLEEELNTLQRSQDRGHADGMEVELRLSPQGLTLRELRTQLRIWKQPLTPRKRK